MPELGVPSPSLPETALRGCLQRWALELRMAMLSTAMSGFSAYHLSTDPNPVAAEGLPHKHRAIEEEV